MRPFGHLAVMNAVCENWKTMIFNWEITQLNYQRASSKLIVGVFFSIGKHQWFGIPQLYFENTHTHKWIWVYHSEIKFSKG